MTTRFVALFIFCLGFASQAGAVSFTNSFAENFDSMDASGTTPPPGWIMKNGNSGSSATTWQASITANGANSVVTMVNAATPLTVNDAPTGNNNNGYNAQGSATSDRVLATAPTTLSGNGIELSLTNASGFPISIIQLGYDIRRYTAASTASILPGYQVFYSLDNGTTWTNDSALNPTIAGPTGVIVPNTAGVTTVPPTSVTLSSAWPNGGTLLLRWVDDNANESTPDQIIGLDNVSISTLGSIPPTVEITAPTAGGNFTASADISITANAADTDGTVAKVEFFNGATKLGEDTTAPYSYSWTNVATGSYTLAAKATDNDGLVKTSSAVNITVGASLSLAQNFDSIGTTGTTPPSGWSIKNSESGTGNSTWTSSIAANGASASVTSMVAAAGAMTASTTPSGNNNNGFNAAKSAGATADRVIATAPTTVAGGAIQWQVVNTDNVALTSVNIGYDIVRYTAASPVNELPGYWLFYSLDNGSTWTNASALNPTISGSTGVVVPNTTGVTTVPPTEVVLSSAWNIGATLLLRWVDDNADETSPDQIIGLDNVTLAVNAALVGSAPMVSITAPLATDTFTAPAAIAITANASDSDGTISKVEFYNGATILGEDTTAPYGYNWTNVAAGSYSVTARATDNNSNIVTSSVRNVTVGSGPSGTLARGPYLQQAGPDTITIRWRSSQLVVGRVKVGSSPTSLDTTVNEATATTEHVVKLSGLTANTTYYYSIGSSGDTLAGGDTTCTFTTSPVVGTAVNTRIWVLGDAGTANSNQIAVRDAFYNWTGSHTPNLVLQLGDNAYNSGTDSEFQSAMFNMYGTMLKKSPFWSCLGNHETGQSTSFVDTYPYFDIYTFPTAGECGGVASGTEHYFSFDYGNIHFISLDSMTASRSATGAMATWLTNDLASTTATWIVAFFHHPPYTKGSHNSDTETPLIEMRSNILPILENGGVDLVLCGHCHSYERSYLLDGHYGLSSTFDSSMKKDGGDGRPAGNGAYVKPLTGPRDHFGAVYSVTGSAGQTSGGTLNHPAHFISLNNLGSLVLDVNGPRLDATFVRENGTTPDSFTIVKQGAADTDGDGMSDVYEISNGLNRYVNDSSSTATDSDGLTNFLEFAFGLNPLANDAGSVEANVPGALLTKRGQPAVWYQTSTEGTDFRVIFIRRKDAAEAGLVYTPQFSGDLINWENSNVTTTVVADGGEVEVVSINYPVFAAGKKARYFRMVVSSNH